MKKPRRRSPLCNRLTIGCGLLAVSAIGFAAENDGAQVLERAEPVRKVVNIVNFVRALDPRMPKAEYVRSLDEEVKLNRKYGFPNTILMQYDALVDDEMLATARKSDPEKTEFGFWFEMSQPLNEAAGLEWKPTEKHKDWKWDWYINPGFLMAYDHDGRRKLVDAAFAKFKATFGFYPKSVGSWLLDAYSMDYMVEKYGVDGFCICREQDSTDAYGLRGGYSNGAYYPSKKNMLSAAVDMKNAVRAPVFKMLTPDPIYNYGLPTELYGDYPYKRACATMEPVWDTGFEPYIVDWFFRVYTESKGLVNLSYMQAGQENSFDWNMISRGWPMQCAKIAAESADGHVVVETMGNTARRFKADHPANCPQTQIALEDWNGNRRKSIWYNSRFYRANMILEGGKLIFRDIHKMIDEFEEPFLNSKCEGWRALYFTPPIVDQWLFRSEDASGAMTLSGDYASLTAEAGERDSLVVTAIRSDGAKAEIRFDEGCIILEGCELSAEYEGAFRKNLRVEKNGVDFEFSGCRYRMLVGGSVVSTEKGFRIDGKRIRLDFSATSHDMASGDAVRWISSDTRIPEKIILWPEGRTPSFQEKQKAPYLLWFRPNELKTKAVLIAVSGGGYNGNDIAGFEVAPIRDYMLAKGMTVVTMLYRTPRPEGLPKYHSAWQDAQRTVRIVRNEARKRGLDPDSIGFTGCSAGGHLAVMTAVSSQTPAYEPVDELDAIPCNVNWAIPVYPAYLLADGLDQYNVTRGNDLAVGFAPEFAFDAATPPMCLFHGDADDWSAMGSVRTYHKLRTMGIPAEVHVLARENHCFQSNPRPGTPAAIWKDFAWAWLVSIDAVTGHPATWGKEWVSPLKPSWDMRLSDCGDFEPGTWRTVDWAGAVLTADKGTPFWLKGEFDDFTLDFEYRLDTAAETGILVRADTAATDWASSALLVRFPVDETGAWNRMTVWAKGDGIRARVNGADLDAKWLVNPAKALAAKGAIGFCGLRGEARPFFRNIHVKKSR